MQDVKATVLADLYGNPERAEIVERLCELGPVALYGGAIRDHTFNHYLPTHARENVSDFDLVVDCDPAALGPLVSTYGAGSNPASFKIPHLKLDFWTLSNTAGGHATVGDVANHAFINWHAVTLNLQTSEFQFGDKLHVHTSWTYETQLSSGFVELHAESFQPYARSIRRLCRFIGHPFCTRVGPSAKKYLEDFSKTPVQPEPQGFQYPPPGTQI